MSPNSSYVLIVESDSDAIAALLAFSHTGGIFGADGERWAAGSRPARARCRASTDAHLLPAAEIRLGLLNYVRREPTLRGHANSHDDGHLKGHRTGGVLMLYFETIGFQGAARDDRSLL